MADLISIRSLNKAPHRPRIKVRRMRDFGCYWDGENLVEICKGLRSRSHLNTLIHELLHHYCPYWSEKKVGKVANQMTAVLWEHRFRRIEK